MLASDANATAALLQAVQNDASWAVRRAAVIALGRVGPDLAHCAWVVQQLGERDETVRAVCMDALRQMNVADPWKESRLLLKELIVEVVEEQTRSVVGAVLDVTRTAAMRLGVVDVLARRLKSGTMEQKWQGVQAVERMGARASEHAPLVAQLLTHPDESLVRAAIIALAAIGPKACDAIDAGGLDQVIVSGTEWETRFEALQCVRAVAAVRVTQMRLQSVDGSNATADQLASRWASAVAPALADRHKEVRTCADRALGSLRIKPEMHVEQVKTVFSYSDWHCRREACRVLGDIGRRCSLDVADNDYKKRMLELFNSIDTDGDMELDTAEITTKLQRDFELHRLLAAIGRTPQYILGHLEETSGSIKLADFVQIFKPAGQAQQFNIVCQAATAVAEHGLMDANVDVREAAKTALLCMGKDTTIKVLMDRIALSSDDEAKINSAETMVAILNSAPLQKDGAHSLRHDAQAAAELALKQVARALLDSSNWRVRAAGAASLGAAGALAEPFIRELEALADDTGSLTITGTPVISNLDGEYFPSVSPNSQTPGRVTLWKRGGRDGKREGGMLIYDGGMKPCPRWILARGFEALSETALSEAILSNTLHVGNLQGRFEEKESEVTGALLQFGNMLGVTIRNRRHMNKPSWALVTFATKSAADAAVPRAGEEIRARGIARSFWMAKIDVRQVAASQGGMGQTMRAHMAKLKAARTELDEQGWSVQWSTRRNVRSADLRDWRGKAHIWSLRQQQGNLLGVSKGGQLPADAPPRGGMGTKEHRPNDLPVGTTGWRWSAHGREEVAVRIDHNCPKEQTMAVVDAARQAVIAIKQALLQKKGVLTTAATSDCSSSGDASAVDSAETATLQGEQSAAEPTTDQEELEAALDRDQVKELLAPFANDLDTSLASASQAALSAWQEASRKKIIIGRGTRQAEASSARGALQRSVRRVALEGSVARNFRGGASNNLD
jgi:HEAT repeat protein